MLEGANVLRLNVFLAKSASDTLPPSLPKGSRSCCDFCERSAPRPIVVRCFTFRVRVGFVLF